MSAPPSTRPPSLMLETIARLALTISLVALSIDGILPALGLIGTELEVANPNHNQLILSVLFLGFGIGQLGYGPLSDSLGRKPAIYLGLWLFVVGCVFSMLAENFAQMLAGRFLQGLGAAGPRIVTVALVRDQYEGRAMARLMSFVMGIFILVPALAPSLGQFILSLAHWRWIFGVFLLLAVIVWLWFALRQPETLAIERRQRFALRTLGQALRGMLREPLSVGYTLAAGLIFSAFLAYLSLAQPILQVQYGLGEHFPRYFAALALTIGAASYVNGSLVLRLGMELLSELSLWGLSLVSGLFLVVVLYHHGHPPLWSLMTYLMTAFFCIGFLFGNLNTLALQPLGHIAGLGAAMIGAVSTFIALPLGGLLGQSYAGTVTPLVGGFALFATLALGVVRWTERIRAKHHA